MLFKKANHFLISNAHDAEIFMETYKGLDSYFYIFYVERDIPAIYKFESMYLRAEIYGNQQRKTTCLFSIRKLLACPRAFKLTITYKFEFMYLRAEIYEINI